jgi:hypothetical protein
MTEGEARKIVVGVREEDGFAAWYSLHRRFEPALQNRQGIALTELNKLLLHPAKTPGDMRTLLTTLEEKMKMVEDITKEKVGPSHAKSILIGLLDPITRQHTAMIQGVNTGYHALKDAVMTFTNNAVGLQGTGGGGLGTVQEHPGDGGCGGPGGGDYEHQDGGEGYLGAFGKGVSVTIARTSDISRVTAPQKEKEKVAKNDFMEDSEKVLAKVENDLGKTRSETKAEAKEKEEAQKEVVSVVEVPTIKQIVQTTQEVKPMHWEREDKD